MAHGKLVKVEIKDKEDANKKIQRTFYIEKWLYNAIIDRVEAGEEESFSFWVVKACKEKLNRTS